MGPNGTEEEDFKIREVQGVAAEKTDTEFGLDTGRRKLGQRQDEGRIGVKTGHRERRVRTGLGQG